MTAKLKTIPKFSERRRHLRVEVTLLGRYMLQDRREFPCQTVNMSPGGLAIDAPVRGAIGERVVVYLDQLGRVEGRVVRHTERGFAIQMTMPFAKREKIANQLTWLVNRDTLGIPEGRSHERIVPHRRHSILHVDGDHEHIVQLIDVSVSGAAVSTSAKPAVGTKVKLGQTNSEIVRVFDGGVAVRFDQPIPADKFDENVKL
jgi:PilZ domain